MGSLHLRLLLVFGTEATWSTKTRENSGGVRPPVAQGSELPDPEDQRSPTKKNAGFLKGTMVEKDGD